MWTVALSWFPWDSPLRSFVVGSWLAASFFDHGWWFGLQLQESLPSLFALGCVAVSLLNPPIHFEWIEHRTADWVDKLPSGSVVVELTRAHLADLAESNLLHVHLRCGVRVCHIAPDAEAVVGLVSKVGAAGYVVRCR